MAEYDTNELISDIQQRGSLPANDLRFTDALILAAATRELREGVAPLLVASRAEHMVYTSTTTVVSGTAQYRMPSRAVGGALRDVNFTPSGAGSVPQRLRELSSDEVEIIGNSNNQGTPSAYYVRNYYVVLVPQPNLAGTLTMPFYARPNRLVLAGLAGVSGARAVACFTASYNTVTGSLQLTVDGDPPAVVNGGIAGSQALDIVRAGPGFETLTTTTQSNTTIVEASPNVWLYTITGFTANPGVEGGDYICVPGEAPVPQVPVELHGLLAARTAKRLVASTGDDRWESLAVDVAELEQKAKDWLAPRVAGHTQQAGGSIGYSGLCPVNGFGFGWGL